MRIILNTFPLYIPISAEFIVNEGILDSGAGGGINVTLCQLDEILNEVEKCKNIWLGKLPSSIRAKRKTSDRGSVCETVKAFGPKQHTATAIKKQWPEIKAETKMAHNQSVTKGSVGFTGC